MDDPHVTEIRDDALRGRELEEYLQQIFGGPVITTSQFKRVMQISDYQLREMRRLGTAPNLVPLTCGNDEGRYLISEIAKWIEKNRRLNTLWESKMQKRGRGRPRKMIAPDFLESFLPMPLPAA